MHACAYAYAYACAYAYAYAYAYEFAYAYAYASAYAYANADAYACRELSGRPYTNPQTRFRDHSCAPHSPTIIDGWRVFKFHLAI